MSREQRPFLARLLSVFWPDSGRDLAGDPQAVIAWVWVVLLLFVGGGTVWMATTQLASAVLATGSITVPNNRTPVQHPSGGVVKRVLVKDGDLVHKGQLLIELEDERSDAAAGLFQQMRLRELMRQARARAEVADADHVDVPPELQAQAQDPSVTDLIERERAYFQARRSMVRDQLNAYEEQIDDVDAEGTEIADQEQSTSVAKDSLVKENEMMQSLADQGYVTKPRLLAYQRSLAEYDMRLHEYAERQASRRQRLNGLRLAMTNLKSNYRDQAANELKDSTSHLEDMEQQIRPTEDAERHKNITAGSDGRIIDLKVHTAGTVVVGGQVLAQIVPNDAIYIIEATINVADFKSINVGDKAQIRLVSFNQRTTPMIDGKISYISADSETDPSGNNRFYRIQIDMLQASLHRPSVPGLRPGLPVAVFIPTGKHSMMQYLLSPILTSVDHAFREQ